MRKIEDIKSEMLNAVSDAESRALTNKLILEMWAALQQLEVAQQADTPVVEEKQRPVHNPLNNLDYRISLIEMPLSMWTKKGLARAGIMCLEDLEGWTAYDLYSLHHVGLKAIQEVGAYMAENGKILPGLDTIKKR